MGEDEDNGGRLVQKGSVSGKDPLVDPRDSVRGAAAPQQDDGICYASNEDGLMGHAGKPELPSSSHFFNTRDLLLAVTRGSAMEGWTCVTTEGLPMEGHSLLTEEFLDPRSEERFNATYHCDIEHHKTVKKGHFVTEQEPSSSSSKAMHQVSCTKEVPADVIREIASRLPCDLAVSKMASSGPSLAGALREVGFRVPGTRDRLPWLLVPYPGGPVFCCMSCGGGVSFQHTVGIAEGNRWARYIGAAEGFWLVVARTRIDGNMIFNLRSRESFALPNQAIHGGSVQQLLLLATTLSSAPDKPNCIGMAIVKYIANLLQSRRAVFFTPGGEFAIDHLPGEYFDEPEDLTYYDSSFWLLTSNDNLHRWEVDRKEDGDIALEKWQGFLFQENQDYGGYVIGRYLVASRGVLLLVVRLSTDCYAVGGETTEFRIYSMKVINIGEEDEVVRCRWNELDSLEGRLLFIGRGCSMCFEASQYPWLTPAVYFCDGRTTFYAEGLLNNVEFPCSDNGRWSAQDSVDRCFPQECHWSSYSSSGWVLQ